MVSYQLNGKLDPCRRIRLLGGKPDVYEGGSVLVSAVPPAVRPRHRKLERRPVLVDARNVDIADAVARIGGGSFSFRKDPEPLRSKKKSLENEKTHGWQK